MRRNLQTIKRRSCLADSQRPGGRPMRMPRLIALNTLSTVALATASCSTTPINPKEVADHVADGSREVVHQSGGGIAFAQSSDSGLQTIASGLRDASNSVSGMPAPMPAAMTFAL